MVAGYKDWTRAIQLLGRDAVTGELVTIGLDGDGRISVYLVDDTDQWGQVLAVGNAELAGRLGFPASWDQRGHILWWTDFRDGLAGLNTDTDGAGASVVIDPSYSLSGGYSVKLSSANAGERWSEVGVAMDAPPVGQLGAYIRWMKLGDIELLELHIEAYGSVGYYHAAVRYDQDNDRLDYLDSDEEWQVLEEHFYTTDDVTWHNLKLAIDWSAGTYLRVLAGGAEYDMSEHSLYREDHGPGHGLECRVRLYAHEGVLNAWVDTMAVTVGEPA